MGFKLAVTLTAAAYAIGKYFFGGKDDDDEAPPPPPPPPPRDSYYYSGSSYNSGSSWNQTQQSYKPPQQSYRPPPPPPSYTYSPPTTHTHSQNTPWTPAPPDYGVYHPRYTRTSAQTLPSHPSVASPYTRTSSQAQSSTRTRTQSSIRTQTQSSTRTQTQASRPYSSLFKTVHDDAHEPPGYGYSQTCSHVHANVYTVSELTEPAAVSPEPRSDELADLEGLDLAKKLREQARRKGLEMTEARSRAKNAQKRGAHGAAHEHTQRANAHESAIKELDKRAAEIIFTEKNKNRGEGIIDLHGLKVAEALRIAKDKAATAKSRGDQVVHFIVGKGLHADDGEAKIRPALQGHFTKEGLTHSLDPKNSGVLVVELY